MSDKVTSSKELKLNMIFADGDTRTLTLDNPKSSLTDAQIESAASAIKSNNAIVGDKAGAAFTRFDTGVVVEKTVTQLDLKN